MIFLRNSFVLLLIVCACSSKNSEEERGPERKMSFIIADSVMVDVLEPLVMDDQQLSGESFLMRGRKSRKPYLISKNGKVIKVYDVLNEGPNGIGANGAFGYNFIGEEEWAAKDGLYRFQIFNLDGEKTEVLESISLGLFRVTVSHYETFYRGFIKENEKMLMGIENNLFNPSSLSKGNRDKPMYYDSVKTIFTYRVKDQLLKQFNAYPETWVPRKERKYVGNSEPFIAYHRGKHLMAVLPRVSNQLFIHDFSGNEPVLLHEVALTHKYRPPIIPEIAKEEEYTSSYPRFTALGFVGDRIIAEFKTRIPEDILERLLAKSPVRVDELPEFQEAKEKFVKTFYLVIEDGKQIGVVEGLPVPGVLDFTTESGEIYVNDNLDPKVEREYNVFYQLELNK
ncbi:hypothetical protein [uncultured Cyclobacterium sp.]|uniref:hypothetical protein n=1 Tax=uncultured Cyclobacterium sp. TaxID=453820 RepID=UPI0030EBF1AB